MNEPIQTCPKPEHWRNLIRGFVDADAEKTLLAHLETCEACQQQMDSLNEDNFAGELRVAASSSMPTDVQKVISELEEDGSAIREQQTSERLTAGEPQNPDDTQAVQEQIPTPVAGAIVQREVIGEGGLGIVYRAFHSQLNRDVAIKYLKPPWRYDRNCVQRFIREARAAARVVHPNVISVHTIEEAAEGPRIIMQFIEGRSLAELMKQSSPEPLPLPDVLLLGLQIIDGLDAAHQNGIVHRDLKPANILVEDRTQRIALTDFGLARVDDGHQLTMSGTVLGTPGWMAPEQAAGKTADRRADLYAFGRILHALLTGRTPKAVGRPFDSGLPANGSIPAELAQLIEQLLQPDPADRPDSVADVRRILKKCARQIVQPEPDLSAVPHGDHRSSRTTIAITSGIFVLLLAALAAFAWWPQSDVASDSASGEGSTSLEEVVCRATIDGVHQDFSKLRAAVRAALGSTRSQIRIQSGGTFELPPMTITGELTIEAVSDQPAILIVEAPNAFAIRIEPGASLTLRNLEVHLDQRSSRRNAPQLMHVFNGELNADCCRLFAGACDGIVAREAARLTLDHSAVDAGNAVTLQWFRECPLVEVRDSDIRADVGLVCLYEPAVQPEVRMRDSYVIANHFARIRSRAVGAESANTEPGQDHRLRIQCHDSFIIGRSSLIMLDHGADIQTSLVWDGKDNHYDVPALISYGNQQRTGWSEWSEIWQHSDTSVEALLSRPEFPQDPIPYTSESTSIRETAFRDSSDFRKKTSAE